MSEPTTFPDHTARHALPVLFAGQAQKEFTFNEAIARIDALLHPTVMGEASGEPGNPSAGDCYIVAAGAGGAFDGHDASIASYDGQQWTFLTPTAGMSVFDASTTQMVRYDTSWQRATAPALPAGGDTIDTEARQAIAELVSILQSYRIIS